MLQTIKKILMASVALSIFCGLPHGAFAVFTTPVEGDGESTSEIIDGEQEINDGGIAYDATIVEDGIQEINDGGIADGSTIEAEGIQNINDGGIARDTTIETGGVQNVLSGGIARDTLILTAGTQNIESGGTSEGDNSMHGLSFLYVLSGGTLAGTLNMSDGALAEVVGGTSTAEVTLGGDSRFLVLNGTVSGDFNLSNNSELDIENGTVSGNINLSGTSSQIVRGGTVTGITTLTGSSTQDVTNTGVVNNTFVNNGTSQTISGGGTAIGTTVNNGGTQNLGASVVLGGTTTINTGGTMRNVSGISTVTVGALDASTEVMINGGRILLDGASAVTMNISPKVIGNGILQMKSADTLNFTNLSGTHAVYVTDLSAEILDSLVFYSATDGVTLTLDSRADEIGEYKAKIVDNGVGGGISILQDLDSPAGFVENIGRESSMNLAIMDLLSNSLHKRLGELQWQKDNKSGPIAQKKWSPWARALATDMKLSKSGTEDVTFGGLELGFDANVMENKNGRVLVGAMMQYAMGGLTYENDTVNGEGDFNSYALGLYATWLGRSGYFVDVAARGYLMSNDVTDYSNMEEIGYKTSQMAFIGGVEAGREIVLREHSAGQVGLVITPRAQINAGYLGGDEFTASNGFAGKINSGNLLNGQLGFLAGARFVVSQWDNALVQPYVKAALKYELGGKTSGELSNADLRDESLHGMRYELGLGANVMANDSWSFYADGVWQNGSGYQSIGGTIGARMNF